MAQDAGRGIDPRFDARFQRGYDGATTPAEAPDSQGRPAGPPPAAAHVSEAPVADDAATAQNRPLLDLGEDAVATTDATIPTARRAPAGDPAPIPAEPLEPTRFRPAPRLWIALVASLGFIVVGAGVLWTLVSDPDFFMGRAGSAEEQAVMQFMMNLAPGFVQAGVVGVIVVLVAWAVGARRAGSDGTDL